MRFLIFVRINAARANLFFFIFIWIICLGFKLIFATVWRGTVNNICTHATDVRHGDVDVLGGERFSAGFDRPAHRWVQFSAH